MSSSQVEERLQVYVDEKIEALRSEVLALIAKGNSSPPHDVNNAAKLKSEDEAQKGETPVLISEKGEGQVLVVPEKGELPALVSEEHLDQHDSYSLGQSVWDSSLFIGLDCVGPGESVVLFLLVCLNGFVQVYFCWIISFSSGMLDSPLSNETLDGLLRFRTSVAHDVGNADQISGRSLLSQVCNGASRLHVSGPQLNLNEDIEAFLPAGPFLCLLALLCWSASVLGELTSTLKFLQAVLERRGKSTRIVVAGDEGLELESLSNFDIAKVALLGILPRLANAVLLFYVGVLYLSITSRLEDLLLNAMALAFVMEVDELFFEAFVPHRVKSLSQAMQPLHLDTSTPIHRQWFQRCSKSLGGSVVVILKLLIIVCILAVVYQVKLVPFYGRLRQASDILCSGEQDFVYSINPSSGTVVATRSAPESEWWPSAECAVLQLAQPDLREEFGWSPPSRGCPDIPDLERLKDSVKSAPVQLRPEWVDSLDSADFMQSEFDHVSSLGRGGTEEAALSALCQDQASISVNGSATFQAALRDAVGVGANVSSCEEVEEMCSMYNMTRVRALCPVTCQCNLWGFTAAGLYKSPNYGCPQQCEVEATVAEQLWTSMGIYPLECLDFTNTRYFFPPGLDLGLSQLFGAMDGDEDGNITKTEVVLGFLRYTIDERIWRDLFFFDMDGDEVWDPSEQSFMAGVYDAIKALDKDGDEKLSSAEASASPGLTDTDKDGFITASDLAGHPQGLGVAVPPMPKRITVQPMVGAISFLLGVVQYLWNRPNFVQSSKLKVEILGDYMGLTQEQEQAVVSSITDGSTFENWIWGKWLLAPNLPHPRGLVWCEFLASWEVTLLLGLDLCKPSDVTTVRTMCPVSCHCEAGWKDCPSSCRSAQKTGNGDP